MRREQTEGEPIMPKLKTHSASKNEIQPDQTGKVKCAKANKSHILTKKDTKRTRRLRAGGYADRAHKSRVYAVYMNGAVEQLGRRSAKAIQPGCEIVVPSKPQKTKMSTAEMMTIGTSTASIATMIATLVNIFK